MSKAGINMVAIVFVLDEDCLETDFRVSALFAHVWP